MGQFGIACPKPAVGAYVLERKKNRTKVRTAEDTAKRKSKARDGMACRAPHATREEYDACKALRLESGHIEHKGMGGDLKGERSSTTADYITFGLRCHRERFDRKVLRPKFLTPDRGDGVIAWEELRGERWFLVHVERRIGDANERWRRR